MKKLKIKKNVKNILKVIVWILLAIVIGYFIFTWKRV